MPVILLVEVVGKGLKTVPEQKGPTGLNNGIVLAPTVNVAMAMQPLLFV